MLPMLLATLGTDGADACKIVLLWALFMGVSACESDPYQLVSANDNGIEFATVPHHVVPAAELARRSLYNTYAIKALLGAGIFFFLRILYRWLTDLSRCARLSNHVQLAWATEAKAFRASPAAQAQPTQRKGPITRGLSSAAKLLSAQFKEERAKAKSESRDRFHERHARAKKSLSSLAPRALLMVGLAQLAFFLPPQPSPITVPTSSQLSMAPGSFDSSVSRAEEPLDYLLTTVLGGDFASVLAQPWFAGAVWETLQDSATAGPMRTLALALTLLRPRLSSQERPQLPSPRRW